MRSIHKYVDLDREIAYRQSTKCTKLKFSWITFYRDRNRVVEFLLPLENKQQIMPNNVETQHKHMYS